MGLFDFISGSIGGSKKSDVLEVAWSKNADGKFRRLSLVSAEKENLSGVSAIYIIWHGGVKPGWVYVGMADDLAVDINDAKQSRDIMEYNGRGGLYVTWQTFPSKMAPGVFSFLTDVLAPEIRNPEADMYRTKTPVKVLPPGYTKESFAQLL